MIIQGFQKVTLLDFPGEVASTLFTYGCNMRCPFCQNPELVIEKKNKDLSIDWEEIYSYFGKRKNMLGGVCITGGEPLLHDDLDIILDKIHSLGLKTKLDTNGTLPGRLKRIKPDYIAMDIKTSLNKYDMLGYTGENNIGELIRESINWIIGSGIDHEFRTTIVPDLVTIFDVQEIAKEIKGAKRYILAQFRNNKLLDKNWENKIPYKHETLEEMKRIVIDAGIECIIRANY